MAFVRIPILTFALALQVSSFSPNASCGNLRSSNSSINRSSKLFSIIKGEAEGSAPFDENEGGVGLAKRSAIKIVGVVNKGKGVAQDIVRYEKIQQLDMSAAKSVMDTADCQLLFSGAGKEMYQDPGSSGRYQDKTIVLAPVDAAKNAVASGAVTIGEDTKSVVFNFLGGDDLIIGEILEACELMASGLDLSSKTKIQFNSMSSTEIPGDQCAVTMVASGGKAGGFDGEDESVARGELYVLDGKWFTVSEADVTTATN